MTALALTKYLQRPPDGGSGSESPTALVVFESMFGHTRRVAEAVAAGLGERIQVTVREVTRATPAEAHRADFVVLGAPTHAFSLSRPSTRADATSQGAQEGSKEQGMREWLSALPPNGIRRLAIFDTRVSRVRRLPGSAARKIAATMRHDGTPIVDRQSFFVEDVAGPLLPDELTRARAWGARLATLVLAHDVSSASGNRI
jgi:hypothetical protein